jgi:hypothetical protein
MDQNKCVFKYFGVYDNFFPALMSLDFLECPLLVVWGRAPT